MTRRRRLIACLACGIVAAFCVFAYTSSVGSAALSQRQRALERYGGEQVSVLVACRDLAAGHQVEEKDVETADWVVDLLPQADVAQEPSQVVGKVLQSEVKEGELLPLHRLGSGTSRIAVPEGLEAVSVASDDVLAVGGAIQAGSFVDVYVESSGGQVTLLGKRVLVIETSAVENNEKSSQGLTWVTLAVTEDSVNDLISAAALGTVHLALPGTQKGGDEQ